MAFPTIPVNKVSDVEWFLRRSAEKLGWDNLTGEVVIDVGCGTGKSSVAFVTLFPDVKKVIGIDIHKLNVKEARAINSHEKLDYEVANIRDRTSLIEWEGKVSKAISTYCFSTLSEPKEGFVNLHRLLRPGGEAALLIKLEGPYDKFLEKLWLHPVWADYVSKYHKFFPPSYIRCMQPTGYESIAKNSGFQVVESYAAERVYDYESAEEYKSFLFRSLPIEKKIPIDLESSCKDDLSEIMQQLCSKTENGKFCTRNNILSLLLRKPEKIIANTEYPNFLD